MTVTQLTNKVAGVSLQGIVRQSVAANNSVLAGCNVHWIFRGSVVDLETGLNGLRWMILRILSSSPDRGMTTGEIIAQVRMANGFDKYPDKTVLHNLGVVLVRAGQVIGVRQTGAQDRNRTSKVPRKLWFIVK